MPRTKRRTVKRPSTDVSDNITMINQPKNVKELIEEFDIESKIEKLLYSPSILCLFNFFFIFRSKHQKLFC